MTTGPRLSVIIPHLNHAQALHRCLCALAEQRERSPEFEVIVVDNGSRTQPVEVCAAFDFVRLAFEAEPGPGPARNLGARLATADLLAFTDADCTVDPDWVSNIVRFLDGQPEVSIIGGDVRIACKDPLHMTAIEAYESIFGYRIALYVRRDHFAGSGNLAVRKPVFESVGGFSGIMVAEDRDWGQRAHAMGHKVVFRPEMLISTPARQDFAELARKWDRHIGHDYEGVRTVSARVRWAVRTLAMALSPMAEVPRVAMSDRVSGIGNRWRAMRVLTAIRLYRARKMAAVLLGGDGAALSGAWNRKN